MHIEVREPDGDLLVRDSIVAAFFCKKSYPSVAAEFGRVFASWLARTPEDARRFAAIGAHAEEFKPLTSRSLARARVEFDPARAKTRDMCSLDICGPQEINADRMFHFSGSRDLAAEETCDLEIRTPTSEVENNPDEYVEFVRRVAELIPYDSGYASPALVFGVDAQQLKFARAARAWAFRHPGFDLPKNDATGFALGSKLRGAYWLTFVGPDALARLGGETALQSALPVEVEVQPAGIGVMLRLGKMPEVGDVNRMENLPIVRATAKVLEPVSRFNDNFLNHNFIDSDERARWERRHLD